MLVIVGTALARASDWALDQYATVLARSGTLVECGAASTFPLIIRCSDVAPRMTVQPCNLVLSASSARFCDAHDAALGYLAPIRNACAAPHDRATRSAVPG